jgi:hypothetical protein
MKNLVRIALASCIAATSISLSAQAMPLAPIAGEANVAITQVRYGCGWEMTRGPYGNCRPRFTCPRGWHPGPYGWHCFRNYW